MTHTTPPAPNTAKAANTAASEAARPRLLLLMSPNTYRAEAFVAAARTLEVEIVCGVDIPEGLRDLWNLPLPLDFVKPDESVRRIVEYAHEHPVAAIVSVDDGATIIAARANAALGLPSNSPAAAEAARDKGAMRDAFARAGVASPVYRRFPITTDPRAIADEVTFPCVVKPLRLSGSRGVIRADDPDELLAAFDRTKRLLLDDGNPEEGTEVLIENFIPGVEVALEGLLRGGKLTVLALFDKPDPLDGPFFEETIYVTPSRLPNATQNAIAACAEAAANAVGLREGPLHAELRVNERGPWMVELAGRSIGGLCSTILEFGTGMGLEEILLRAALGQSLPEVEGGPSAAGVMMIPIPKGGMLHSVSGVERAQAVPHVTGVEISAKPHTEVVPLPEGASYLGFIFARADDPATAEAALRAAHAELHFDIRPMLKMVRSAASVPPTLPTT